MIANLSEVAAAYATDGYYFPLQAMSGQVARDYRANLESVQSQYSDDEFKAICFGHADFVLPFVDEITRLPSVLEPVKAVLGPDLLVWGTNLFIKEANSPEFVSWHQDLTYWGLDDVAEVTAWVALSPATCESGCMQFIPGTHNREIVSHRDTFDAANLLTRGQEIAVQIDADRAVDIVLEPGEFSLHHGRIFHASRPNRSRDRRIGLAIRYISPAMKNVSGHKGYAHLVAGEDRFGHFELLPPPKQVMAPADVQIARLARAAQEDVLYAGASQKGQRTT
ncbi:MAG: phytanoyl-CoA dioxygenase family protein [Gammaproteobacteria bacterium]|nr:phytanoyl-CoA dioxygenase family protein [Gammaproteobacteria bacterium]